VHPLFTTMPHSFTDTPSSSSAKPILLRSQGVVGNDQVPHGLVGARIYQLNTIANHGDLIGDFEPTAARDRENEQSG
jgi:hypothetical protein